MKAIISKKLLVLLFVTIAFGLFMIITTSALAANVGPRANNYDDPANGIYVSPSGNDSSATGSITAPYKSINAALAAASPGGTIVLRGGTYAEGINVRVRIPNITIKSRKGEWAVIDLTTFNAGHNEDSGVYFDVDSSGGKLQSVEVKGGFYAVCTETKWDWGQPDRSGASNIIIEDCILHDSRNDTVKVKPNCDNITIRYNEIYNSGRDHLGHPDFVKGERNSEGIDNVNGDNMVVQNNYIHDICSTAIYAKGGAINALIENNLIRRAYAAGIMIGFDTSPEYFDRTVNPQYYENIQGIVRNNLIIDVGWEGIGLYAAKDALVHNNTVVNAVGYGTGLYHSPIYFGVATQDWSNPTGCPPSINPNIHHNVVRQPSTYNNQMIDIRYATGVYSFGLSALSGNPTMNYNCYYIVGKNSRFTDNRPGSFLSNAGFTAWQSHVSGESGSVEVDPTLDADYIAINPLCIGAGTRMGILYPLIITSNISVTGVTLSENNSHINVGSSLQLIATVIPSNATNKDVRWSSDNTAVAIVNASGYVTGVSDGVATIKATTVDGGFTDACVVTVNSIIGVPPKITTSNLPTGVVWTTYNQILNATGTTPITWSIQSGSLPTGLTLNQNTGLITGVPITEGTFNFNVRAANSVGNDTVLLSIVVNNAIERPTIITPDLPAGIVDFFYNETLKASGTMPITWTIGSGMLPSGLNLNPTTGVISGAPTKVGTFGFSVIATNVVGAATKVLIITVTAIPTITTDSLPGSFVGKAYNQRLIATGTAPITWSIYGGSLPPGLSLSETTGTITGTFTTAGTFNFNVRATNSVGNDTKLFSIVISEILEAPTILTPSLPGGTVGAAYNETLKVSGTTPIIWLIYTGALPPGLSLNETTGTISGTLSTTGTFNFNIRATNSAGNNARSYSIVVTSPPSILTASLPGGMAGTSYNQLLSATGTTPIIWSIYSGSLPTGLSLNANSGQITGKPTTSGTFSFTVSATNSAGNNTKLLSIIISPAYELPTIITPSLPGGTVGAAYNETLKVSGTTPITWTIVSGKLPDGLSLNSTTGVISGTPTTLGTYSFSVRVSNIAGYVSKTLTIQIAELPIINAVSLPDGVVGRGYSQKLSASGTTPITWTMENGSLPTGLNLNATTGIISGAPTTAGTFSFAVRATNAAGYSTKSLNIIITSLPSIITTSLPGGTNGISYNQTLNATGTTPITWSLGSGMLPNGLILNPTTGVISGVPTKAGTFGFSVRVTNSAGIDTKVLTIIIGTLSTAVK